MFSKLLESNERWLIIYIKLVKATVDTTLWIIGKIENSMFKNIVSVLSFNNPAHHVI